MSLMKYLIIAVLFIASCGDGHNTHDDEKDDNDIDTTQPPPTDTLGHDTSAIITSIYSRKLGVNIITAIDTIDYSVYDENRRGPCGGTEWFNDTALPYPKVKFDADKFSDEERIKRIYKRKVGQQIHRSTVFHYADRRRFVNY